MSDLIQALKKLEADPKYPKPEGEEIVYLTDGEPDDLINLIEALACGELMNSDGTCNWVAIGILQTAGFPIIAGEKDSFGWLTGVILTSKGSIVYG